MGLRKIFLLALLCTSFFVKAQVLQQPNTYGIGWKRTGADTLLYIPADTLSVPAWGIGKAHIAKKGTSLYYWDGSKWSAITGAAGYVSGAVDSLWRTPGVDSIFWLKNGITYKIKDSTGGGTYTAGNGLTLSGSQFKLGGTLTENTTIEGSATESLNFNDIKKFRVTADDTLELNINPGGTGYLLGDNDIALKWDADQIYLPNISSGASTDSVLVWTAGTGQVKKRNVSSLVSTPTLQQVLTAGSTLTINNVINTGINTINIIGGDSDEDYLIINPTINSESSELRSSNTSTTSDSRVKVSTSNVAISSQLESDWGDGLVVSRFENNVTSSTSNSTIISYEEYGKLSSVIVDKDSVSINPSQGIINIDSLRSATIADTLYKKPMTWDTRNGRWEYLTQWPQQKINLVFGAGSGADADTTAFTTSALYGSFYNDADTIVVTSMRGVLQGTSPSVTYQVWYNDSLNVEAGGTKLVTAGNALTNTTTGTNVTSFDVTKIPPGNWVWVKTSTVATKPKYFSLTINGYRK